MNINDINDFSAKQKAYVFIPAAVITAAFTAGFGFIGYFLDRIIFIDWIDKQHYYSALAFAVLGTGSGVAFLDAVKKPLYKRIVPKSDYDEVAKLLSAENNSKALTAAMYALLCLMFALFFFVGGFCGDGLTDNYELKIKDNVFSKTETYPLEATPIAIIDGASDGGEYIDTAYVFYINEEWYEYGVPDDEGKAVIEGAIEKYNIEVVHYNSFEELPYEHTRN